MKLLFKQRFFSWLDSFDIYNEQGEVEYTVEGRLALGHCLAICNPRGEEIGLVKEEILTLLPRFELTAYGNYLGEIKKLFTFFKPAFQLDYNSWQITGNFMEWDYAITDAAGQLLARIDKELFQFTDTYVLDVADPGNALPVLMIALAIDAAKCDR